MTIYQNNNTNVNLISFTIGLTTYQAESGMTWADWVNSEYSNGGYYIAGSYISPYLGAGYYVALDYIEVQTTDIISNQNYMIIGGGGND